MTREDAEKIDRVLNAARRLSNVAYHVGNNMGVGDAMPRHVGESARSAVQDFDFEMKEARDAIGWLWADNPYGHGDMHVADVRIRGWGHLTGSGACFYSPSQAVEIQAANARLIAAAPDLLAALKDLLEDTQHHKHNCGDDCPVRRAEAAILKAEGGAA